MTNYQIPKQLIWLLVVQKNTVSQELPIIQSRQQHPLDGTYLDAVRGLIPTKRFHPSASTKRAQLSVAATTVRSTDLFNIMSSPESMLIRQD